MIDLKPGRELDALVACRVDKIISEHDLETLPEHHDDGVWRHIPKYSTEIAAAWELVEKLRSSRSEVGIIADSDGWYAFEGGGEDMFPLSPTVPTAPYAICLAALKAVQHE
jgi:hypothetical protein